MAPASKNKNSTGVLGMCLTNVSEKLMINKVRLCDVCMFEIMPCFTINKHTIYEHCCPTSRPISVFHFTSWMSSKIVLMTELLLARFAHLSAIFEVTFLRLRAWTALKDTVYSIIEPCAYTHTHLHAYTHTHKITLP